MTGDDLQKIENMLGNVRIQLRTEDHPCRATITGAPNKVREAKSMIFDLMERLAFESGPPPQQQSLWPPPANDEFPPRPPAQFPPQPPVPQMTPPPMVPPPMIGQGGVPPPMEWPPHLANLADRERMINTMTWPDGTTYAQKEERLKMLTQHIMGKGKGFGKRSSSRSSSSSSSSPSPARPKQRTKTSGNAEVPQAPPVFPPGGFVPGGYPPGGYVPNAPAGYAPNAPSWPNAP
eukprot:CAMPEP_0169182710 /NCGR_PEP_ID=MMETSP1016-20121227/215_1 /TAXON_ID=342587 /ORGANISM="Karlodinium micrum, Strain CCMP2283" /LENGTH=233 /DNA_ID=CAMNT_0009257979 /DNA_START=1 /DNA_END=698 /DNA_ORIENTATION=-